jgi:hypothetical protein
MCSKPATSREHAPPLCLFPEINDVSTGENYRKNLITVPSCDTHNSKKSKDDQFLLLVLLLHYKNNEVGQNHLAGKLIRTLERRSGLLGVLTDKEDILVHGSESSGFHIDRDRFDATMDRIARAYQLQSLLVQIDLERVVTSHIKQRRCVNNNLSIPYFAIFSKVMIDKFLAPYPIKGENPAVFYYQIDTALQEKKLLIRMVFYEGFVVYAYSSPEVATWRRN